MQKIVLALCLVLAVASSSDNDENRSEDFINMHRIQHKNVLRQYDATVQQFTELYGTRIDGVLVHNKLLSETLEQTNERLAPITILSDSAKQCVLQHGVGIPTVVDVKSAIVKCEASARNQQNVILSRVVDARNALEHYMEGYFEREIESCANATNVSNYVSCVTTVTSNTSKHVRESQNNFDVQLAAAFCLADANIKEALDCTFTVQRDTIKEVAKANILVNLCIPKEDNCKPCQYKCNEVMKLPAVEIGGERFMLNPFVAYANHPKCLIMRVE